MIFLLSWRVDLQLLLEVIYLQLDSPKFQSSHLAEFSRLCARSPSSRRLTDTIGEVANWQLLLVNRFIWLEQIAGRNVFETKNEEANVITLRINNTHILCPMHRTRKLPVSNAASDNQFLSGIDSSINKT